MSEPCKLRASWFGPPPAIGDFLKSHRGRTAYRIVTITPTSTTTARAAAQFDLYGEPTNGFVFECVRCDPMELPAGAVVHEWKWSARTKRPVVMR